MELNRCLSEPRCMVYSMELWTQIVLTAHGRGISHSCWGIKAQSTRFLRHLYSGVNMRDTWAVDTEAVLLGSFGRPSDEWMDGQWRGGFYYRPGFRIFQGFLLFPPVSYLGYSSAECKVTTTIGWFISLGITSVLLSLFTIIL